MIDEIRILNLVLSDSKPGDTLSKVRATVDVSLDGIRIFDVRVVDAEDGKPPFIRLASRKCYRDDGSYYFKPSIKLPETLKKKLDEVVFAEYFSQLALRKGR